MKYRHLDLLIASIAVLFSVILILADVQIPLIRVPLGILLTLVLPGYLLTEALFPFAPFPWVNRLALTLGISLGITIVGGLLLYLVVGSLTAVSWVFFLGFIILAESLVIYSRRITEEERLVNVPVTGRDHQRRGPVLFSVLMIGLAVAVVFGAIGFARIVAREEPDDDIVQLWMLPEQTNPGGQVRLGINTQTGGAQVFSLVVKRGDVILRDWPELGLQPNEQWETTLELGPSANSTAPIEAFLYDSERPSVVFRQVTLWPDQGSENEASR